MKSVALVTYAAYPALTPSDQLLVEPLNKLRIRAVPAPWDDRKINWKQFDAVILRSCWNYYKQYARFLEWLQQLESEHIRVFNPIDTIRKNSDKTYLANLLKKGVPMPPTVWVKHHEKVNLQHVLSSHGWTSAIVKPAIGAGGHNVFRATNKGNIFTQIRCIRMLTQSSVMVQQFCPEIQTEGEYSFIFIAGACTHTILKKPNRDEYRLNGKFGSMATYVTPGKTLLTQAQAVVHTLNVTPLYARVDGIRRAEQLLLTELELIEPHLFFDLYPPAANAFARAVAAMV